VFKKIALFGILAVMVSCFLWGNRSSATPINDRLIRFHVIANSDSRSDQDLKLKVRDRVLKEIGPQLQKCGSKEESQAFLSANLGNIKRYAESEIAKNGRKYGVSVYLGKSLFPAKSYSNIVLPAGEYDALKIIIGKGEGKNWWCVMFPPLCFIDITQGVTPKDTENEFKSVMSEDEYDSILTGSQESPDAVRKPVEVESSGTPAGGKSEKVEIKFKSVELFESLFAKVKSLFAGK
jgi:stage II sporulation protein R